MVGQDDASWCYWGLDWTLFWTWLGPGSLQMVLSRLSKLGSDHLSICRGGTRRQLVLSTKDQINLHTRLRDFRCTINMTDDFVTSSAFNIPQHIQHISPRGNIDGFLVHCEFVDGVWSGGGWECFLRPYIEQFYIKFCSSDRWSS